MNAVRTNKPLRTPLPTSFFGEPVVTRHEVVLATETATARFVAEGAVVTVTYTSSVGPWGFPPVRKFDRPAAREEYRRLLKLGYRKW